MHDRSGNRDDNAMKYATARNFRAAIDARLKAYTLSDDPRLLVQIRKQITFDRFLARLLTVSPDAWLLKGGTALQYRLGEASRFTKDLDLVLFSGSDFASDEISKAVAYDANDFFSFSLQQSRLLDHSTEGSSRRFMLRAELDGRLFENIIVDVGFDDPSPLPTEMIPGTNFLEFAGISAISPPILPIEVHLSEKLHALARIYEGNRQSTRVKDLIDIVLIARAYRLNANSVRLALNHTFHSRAVHPLPVRLGVPPAEWSVPYVALAVSVNLDPDMSIGHAYAASLLDPLLGGELAETAVWNPATCAWTE